MRLSVLCCYLVRNVPTGLHLIKSFGFGGRNSCSRPRKFATMASTTSTTTFAEIVAKSKEVAPSLTAGGNHKGQAGKIGIVGGSFEYTGAPYFSAISALKVGADLVHVFCHKDAAIPIKCYSPELMVHPLLDRSKFKDLVAWIKRVDIVVVGPGLGRDEDTVLLIRDLIEEIKAMPKPLVIDADGLFVISRYRDLLTGFSTPVVMTPNKAELVRLAMQGDPSLEFTMDDSWGRNVVLLAKGPNDKIISRQGIMEMKDLGGSNRRCGGQGDILSGALAVFLLWSRFLGKDSVHTACYAACKLVRECNEMAFKEKGRSATASDMIEKIHAAFVKHFEH